jgi:hypothetical protein
MHNLQSKNQSFLNYPELYKSLLDLFQEVRKISTDDAINIVRPRMFELRTALEGQYCLPGIIAYERYLNFFSKRYNDPDLIRNLTLLDASKLKMDLAKEPHRSDLLIGLALSYLSTEKIKEARKLLQRIEASGFRESGIARQIHSKLIGEVLS